MIGLNFCTIQYQTETKILDVKSENSHVLYRIKSYFNKGSEWLSEFVIHLLIKFTRQRYVYDSKNLIDDISADFVQRKWWSLGRRSSKN